MSNEIIGIIGLIAFLVLLFLNIPIGVVFILVGGIGAIILTTFEAGISIFSIFPYSWASSYSFACLPMFVLMGLIIAETGTVEGLYKAGYQWLGRLPGGMAMATLFVAALFSAISGSAIAAVATLCVTCYPEMRRYNYDPSLATGVICAGASMDIMIPPSIPMIIFALVTETSVGKLFIAGFVPGLLEVIIFSLFVYVMVKRNPALAPVASGPRIPFMTKVKESRGVAPVAIIFLAIFGGMFTGVFSPTEAGACGLIAAMVVCAAMRRLTWQAVRNSFIRAARITGMCFIVLIGVSFFNSFIAMSGLSAKLVEWIIGLGLSPRVFLIIVLALYYPLGAMMDEISMMLLTIPFYMPAVRALGIDPVWFGILVILAWQVGFIAPPVALLAFVTKGALKDTVPLSTIYKGCLPFLLALGIVELLVLFEPGIALWLVHLMRM